MDREESNLVFFGRVTSRSSTRIIVDENDPLKTNYYRTPPKDIGVAVKGICTGSPKNGKGERIGCCNKYQFCDYLDQPTLSGVKTSWWLQPVKEDNKDICVAAMIWDIDVDLSHDRKLLAKYFIEEGPTMGALFEKFPEYQTLWESSVLPLAEALALSTDDGKPVEMILLSTGFKGFRALIKDARLFLRVPLCEESNAGKNCVVPTLSDKLKIEVEGKIDDGIWGCNKGVRTNLHPHPVTGMWPRVFDLSAPIDDQPYVYSQCHQTSTKQIRRFWGWFFYNLPADLGTEGIVTIPSRKRKRNAKTSTPVFTGAQPSKPVSTTSSSTTAPQRPSEQSPSSVSNLEIIKGLLSQALQRENLPPPQSLDHIKAGQRTVTFSFDNARATKEYLCPRTNKVHGSNNGFATVDLLHGTIVLKCLHPDCKIWSDIQDHKTEKIDIFDFHIPLWRVVVNLVPSGKVILKFDNFRLLNQIMAPLLKPYIVLEPVGNTVRTREYQAETGSWKKYPRKGRLAQRYEKQYVTMLTTLLMQMQDWLICFEDESSMFNCLGYIIEKVACGIVKLQGKFMNYIKPHLDDIFIVDPDVWNAYKRGHLPVANYLLHFNQRTGGVDALIYKPTHYIKSECQIDILYDPQAQASAVLSQLLQQWWPDAVTCRSFLIATAYALSRTACKEVVFVVVGPTGSAKSSYNNLLKAWFGKTHIWPVSSNFACTTKGQVQHQDNMNSHNTNELDAAERAMVVVNECSGSMVWKTDFLKRFTGDDSSGRRANASECEEQPRLCTPFVVVNSIPVLPKKATDTAAIFRRIKILRPTSVFYADVIEKRKLMARMSSVDIANSVWTKADASVVQGVMDDPLAKIQFLNLVCEAWRAFVVEDKKELQMTPEAQAIYDAYIGETVEYDSVLRFMHDCLLQDRKMAVTSRDAFKAYCIWYEEMTNTDEIIGLHCSTIGSFIKRSKTHFADWNILPTRRQSGIVCTLTGTVCSLTKRTSILNGITFKRTFM